MKTAISVVKNEADAQDIVQSSFLQAYESLHKFRAEARFSTWLCRIVINKSLRFLENNTRRRQERAKRPNGPPVTHNQGSLALNRKDLEALLKAGLHLLAPGEALCIQLFHLEEYSVDEIAQITGFTK